MEADNAMKNKSMVVAVVVIVLLLIGIFVYTNNPAPEQETQQQPQIEETVPADYSNLQTSDDDFAAIDDSLAALE